MIHLADEQLAAILDLRMAAQAEVGVGLRQHLAMSRPVRLMAGDAAVTQRLVLKDKSSRLLAVAGGALLVELRHGQPASRFHDVDPMRIMALNTGHSPLNDRVMLGQAEIRVNVDVAVEAGLRTPPRVEDGSLSPQGDVPAPRAVTCLATDRFRFAYPGLRAVTIRSRGWM
jgi:hypothetical protein